MKKEYEISCPKCKAVFTVPLELAGEIAECANCDTIFEIPRPTPNEIHELKEADKVRGYELAPPANSHNTSKHTRTSLGMIPTIKERFLSKSKPAVSHG